MPGWDRNLEGNELAIGKDLSWVVLMMAIDLHLQCQNPNLRVCLAWDASRRIRWRERLTVWDKHLASQMSCKP